jgi:hypothetical protein
LRAMERNTRAGKRRRRKKVRHLSFRVEGVSIW